MSYPGSHKKAGQSRNVVEHSCSPGAARYRPTELNVYKKSLKRMTAVHSGSVVEQLCWPTSAPYGPTELKIYKKLP